jgi:hypothetical protein
VKRLVIQAQLLVFGRCYCASSNGEELMDTLDDLRGMSVAVPVKTWAERSAIRRERRSGQQWRVTKWVAT